MFLSNWLVFKIVLAAVTGLVDYPLAADVLLVYDNANKLYLSGGSLEYVSNVVLYKGETSYEISEYPRIDFNNETKFTGETSTGNFGSRVSIDGDYLAITDSFYDSSDNGKIYIYHRSGTTWSLQNSFQSATSSDYMEAVAISGDYVMAGVRYGDNAGSNAGEVLVYKRSGTTWTNTQTLTASDATAGDHFGFSVTSKGNYAVVGTGQVSGAYVFTLSNGTWSETQLLTTGTDSDLFGCFVNLSDTDLLIGARGVNSLKGTAYIYTNNGGTFTQQAQITPDDLVGTDWFGQNGDIFGDYACVGAPYQNNLYYITQPGTYRADLQICGIDYKTNEVEVTGSVTPVKSFPTTAQKLYPSDGGTVSDSDSYGYVGLSGNGLVMVVVGKGDDDTTADSGGFIVYEKINGVWTFTQQITNVGSGSDTFGLSEEGKAVQLDYTGTRVFIGAHADDHITTNTGSVYIYKRVAQGNWTLEQRIDGGAASYRYGYNDVNNDGDKLMIGSYGYPGSGNVGRVWYYTRSGTSWSLQDQLAAPSTSAYGNSVGINSTGTRAIIGGYTHSSNTGRVDIWNYSGSSWSIGAGFTGENASDNFGWNVDMSNDGNTVVVGAPLYSAGGTEGRVYIYTTSDGTNWSLLKTLSNQDANEWFGFSVQISGDGNTVVIGAGKNDEGLTNRGKSYVYVKSGGSWPSTPTYTILGTTANANNGYTLGISDTGETIISGAPFDDDKGSNQGAVYIFDKSVIAELTFDNYNQLSLTNTPTYTSSKLAYYSNVYDIGTLTSDITIEKQGEYASLTFDTSSNVAYFSNATVGAIGSTQKDYALEQILYGTHNSDSPSQGGFGHYIDTNGDGTRFVLGIGMDPTTGQYDGRVKVYHLESGTWTLKVDIPSPNTASTRFGDSVCMNEDGTRIVVNHYPSDVQTSRAYIYDYASGAWPTTPTATIIGGVTSFGEGDMDMNKAGTVIVFGSRGSGTQIWSRAGDGTWSETKNWGNGQGGYGVAINGAGTRIVTGKESTGEIFEGNYEGGSWGSLTSVIDTSYTSWPAKIRMDSDGTTLIVNADPATEAGIYERQSGTSWTLSQSILSMASYYSRNGLSISYDGNMILVGDMTNDTDGNNFGRAFLWNKSGGSWSLTKTFSNPKTSPAVNDYWGAGVAIAKNTKDRLIIGMSADSTAGTEYGSVYVHTNAIPDYISFDTYNKLSLSGITNPTSKLHALPTGAESTTTYDIGTATNIYIESEGTYTAEMKGSDAFALDSNVTGSLTTPSPNSQLYYPLTSEPSANIWSSTTDVAYGSDGVTFNSTSSTFGLEFTVPTSGIFTVSCNFMKTSFTSGVGVIIASSTNQNSPELESNFTATSYAWRSTNTGYVNTTGLTHYTNQWYHMVWVHDKNNGLTAYLDGVEVYSYSGTIGSPQTSFIVGPNYRSGTITNQFGAGGKMSDIRIYNTAISSTEAELIYKADNKYIPKLNFDTYNKLTFTGADTDSTYKLKYGSNTYDLGTISNVYIAYPGTYSAEIKGATNFALSSNTTGNLGTYSTLHDNVAISHTTGGGQTLVTVNNVKGNKTYKISFNKQWTDSHASYSTRLKMYIRDSSDVNIRQINSIGDYLNDPRDGILLYDAGGSFDESAMVVGTGFSVYGTTGTHTVGITGGTYGSTRSPFTLADPWYFLLTMSTSDVITGKFFVGDTEVISHFLTRPQSGTSGYSIGETGNKFVFEFWDTATISGVNMTVEEYNPAPKLNFDTYNKLTLSGLESGSTSTLKYGSNTYDIGTASNVYISEQGTYEAAIKSATTFALTKNVVGAGQISVPPVYPSVSVAPTVVTPINFTSGAWSGQHYFVYRGDVVQNGITHYHWNLEFQSGNTPVNYSVLYDYVNRIWKDGDGSTPFYMSPSTPLVGTNLYVTNPVNVHGFDTNQTSEYFGFPNPYYQVPNYTPSLTHDGYKLVVKNITPTSTTLKYGSNTYEIGTATNIYVENTGDYSAEIGNATDFVLTNTTVSGTLKTVEPTLSGGNAYLHALSYDGKLYAWGINDDGELGLGDNTNRTTPTLYSGPLVSKILNKGWSGGNTRNETSWIKTVGNEVYATGKGDTYMIPGTTSDLLSFTDVTSYFGDQSLTSNNVVFVGGGERSCVSLTESGNVWTWGTHNSTYWNLGQGTGASSSNTPKQITFGGVTDNISRVAFGHDHGVALDTDGDVWFWGQIWAGGASVDYPQATLSDAQKSPHEIMTSNNIVGVSSTFFTIYAWQSDGTYYALGQDSHGQIGDGAASSGYTSWQKVEYFSANNITINEIYTGQYNVFVDTSDGYYCWGYGASGAFGNGGTGNLASPTKWTNVSNIKLFSAGGSYMGAAITEDGKYYAWGSGSQTQRGDNDTGNISYPKYIDTLPNILAPSFDFDGYDKILLPNKAVKWIPLLASDANTHDQYIRGGNADSSTNGYWYNPDGSQRTNGPELKWDDTVGSWILDSTTFSFNCRINKKNGTWSLSHDHEPGTQHGSSYTHDDVVLQQDTTEVWITTNAGAYIRHRWKAYFEEPYNYENTKYTKDTHTYDTNQAQIVTVSDPGTYDAQIKSDTDFSLKSTTIPATSTTGLYTWAFHHGNFDNAYGDGDILTARENGRFYADTPAYTGDIGTITPTSVSSFVYKFYCTVLPGPVTGHTTDSNDTNWNLTEISSTTTTLTSGMFELANSSYLNNGSVGDLFDGDTSESGGTYSIKNYNNGGLAVDRHMFTITSPVELLQLSISTHRPGYYPGIKIILNDTHTLVNETSNQGTGATPSPYTKSYTFSSNYLAVTHGTTYTFTPASTLTANVLMVAGGGGGGGRAEGGGGGAGGLVYTAGTTLFGTKTIVVGNGDSGGIGSGGSEAVGFNGKDTTFTDLDTAFGGGGGGSQTNGPNTGGSGGGGNGGDGSNYNFNTGASGTSDQGFAGGNGANTLEGGGGGGAGGVGANASSGNAGDGGIGKFFGTGSSFTNFGDEYGEGGYFAGGGGGGNRNEIENIPGGRGGGGYGGNYNGYMARGGSLHGMVHTGGGGGGVGTQARDQHPGYNTEGDGGVKGHGGRGGSGIVLIQTNVAPPNGSNTAVVQVGNPRRRSLPPAVEDTGSEVNRFYIIDSASMPTYKLPTHWYTDPVGRASNSVWTTQGSHSLQKRADGGTSNVFYVTSTEGIFEYGSYMAQSADAIFMPVEAQRYNGLLAIGSNSTNDIHFEMVADGTAALYYDNGATLLSAGTITCFTVGKWHHIALTVDSGGNAVGYVNGYPVVSGTHTSVAAVGSRSGNMHMRVGDHSITFRKFLTYEVSTYNFHMSPKQVLQRAAEVGLGPKLEYDGLNAINVVNTEPGSGTEITIYESNVNDTSNLYVVSCNESSYLLSNAGTYYAQIKGTDTFTITRPLTVTDDHFPLYQYPPVVTGTKSSLTTSLSADTWNTWTMSGASTGNGQYQVKTSHATNAPGGTHATAASLFTNGVKIEIISDGGASIYSFLHTSQLTNFDITLQLPSAKIIRKYVLYPADAAPVSTPGGSVDPTLPGNGGEHNTRRPKSWVLKGSNDDTSWTTIHTVTNKPPSIYGDVHTVSSPASYQYYQLSISANNGSSQFMQLGEWQLWGDA
jgi:alpha-tubulin suppressor-like RCC1 family protein